MPTAPDVLIVDDQSDIRRLLSITLGKEHRIIEAVDGITALEAVRRHHPGLILLDVMMPGELDGLQVLEAIKTNPKTKSTPVAMITARGQLADQNEGCARGADAYFIKPFNLLQVAPGYAIT